MPRDRGREPECPDAPGDLTDLLPGMGPGITRIGPQLRWGLEFDSERVRARFLGHPVAPRFTCGAT